MQNLITAILMPLLKFYFLKVLKIQGVHQGKISSLFLSSTAPIFYNIV